MLYIPQRHEPVTNVPWSVEQATKIIHNIVSQSIDTFQGAKLWPIHPDTQQEYRLTQPLTGLWYGAAGSIWALAQLKHNDANLPSCNFNPYIHHLIRQQPISLAEANPRLNVDLHTPSYLFGYAGIHLLHWKLTGVDTALDALADAIQRNIKNPINELMWAAPGTMLCSWFVYQVTQQPRWRNLFQQSADYLFSCWNLDEKSQCYLWIQHMYGVDAIHLGLVHGFAGNVLSLFKGKNLLSADQYQLLLARTEQTLIKTAITEGNYANWLPCVGKPRPGREIPLLQICHGAPGIVVATAEMWPLVSNTYQQLLIKAGNLIWHAGPLTKLWGLCHGTAGNGYAFLKLYQVTGNEIWLERARQFAMHAIMQYQKAYQQYRCIRAEAWCGDLGLALYLQNCITGNSDYPMLDYF